jgi:hypothetical protein
MVNTQKCKMCKEQALPDRKYCLKHLEKIRKQAASRAGVLCKQCNNPPVEGKKCCISCLEKNRLSSIEKKAKKKLLGLCRDCNNKAIEGLSHCEECRIKYNQRAANVLKQRQEENLCTLCGSVKESADQAYCKKCTEKDNKRLRNRSLARKQNGVCVTCGEKNELNGTQCLNCVGKRSSYVKLWKEAKKQNGICVRCNNFAVKNNVYCMDCKIDSSLRKQILQALRKKKVPKSSRTEDLLGCSIIFFREHIKNLMEPWMNENNYGVHVPGEKKWQLGHRVPVAAFNMKDPDQQKKCWHYTNLYPQEAEENICNGDIMFLNGEKIRGRNFMVD